MTDPIRWTCDCGALEAEVAAGSGSRCICYCSDCQAFARHLWHGDMLDRHGGSDIYQTTPNKVRIIKGAENLACLRITDKGPLRWYSACCKTPFANSGSSPALPLASMMVRRFDRPERAGPVIARVNRKDAIGHIEEDAGSIRRLMWSFGLRAFIARLTRRHRRTPFFRPDGTPVAPPTTLSEADRVAAYTRSSDS